MAHSAASSANKNCTLEPTFSEPPACIFSIVFQQQIRFNKKYNININWSLKDKYYTLAEEVVHVAAMDGYVAG